SWSSPSLRSRISMMIETISSVRSPELDEDVGDACFALPGLAACDAAPLAAVLFGADEVVFFAPDLAPFPSAERVGFDARPSRSTIAALQRSLNAFCLRSPRSISLLGAFDLVIFIAA